MGSSEAFHAAHDALQRLAPSLRRFAHALLGGRGRASAAEDLVQAALDRVRDTGFETESALKHALYAALVAAHRNRQSTYAQPGLTRRPGREGIVQMVDQLPLDQREVLLLVVVERFSYDATAAILALPRSSIVARLVRARASLAATSTDAPPRAPHLRLVT